MKQRTEERSRINRGIPMESPKIDFQLNENKQIIKLSFYDLLTSTFTNE